MYVGNPGEIDFGSSSREVRVSEGSSCRESTVVNTVNKRHGKIIEVGKQEKNLVARVQTRTYPQIRTSPLCHRNQHRKACQN